MSFPLPPLLEADKSDAHLKDRGDSLNRWNPDHVGSGNWSTDMQVMQTGSDVCVHQGTAHTLGRYRLTLYPFPKVVSPGCGVKA